MLKDWKSWLIIAALCIVLAIAVFHPNDLEPEPEPYKLPTILEVQRILIAEGFDIEADGILGPATQRAWEAHDTGLKQWWDESEE